MGRRLFGALAEALFGPPEVEPPIPPAEDPERAAKEIRVARAIAESKRVSGELRELMDSLAILLEEYRRVRR